MTNLSAVWGNLLSLANVSQGNFKSCRRRRPHFYNSAEIESEPESIACGARKGYAGTGRYWLAASAKIAT